MRFKMIEKNTYPISQALEDLEYKQIADLDENLTDGEGWEFYSSGQIRRATVFENKLAGRVGNFFEEYEVEIIVSDSELRGSCNCSRTGQFCKHMLALLYCWVNDAEGFTNVGDSLLELKSYEKERLLEIVANIIIHDPKNIERFLYSEESFDDLDTGYDHYFDY